ncbi:MAG: hypothetical protein A2138_13545 [Deltaproteobacteria bacterium RBG_16_71_12]|nr:MAG: hypothetical protein A2138_13545 [Deltaproteobacteria bacterium RBG_16_71_12]
MNARTTLLAALAVASPLAPACACGDVGSEEDARIAYLGVDDIVTKSLALGFAGFNAASSANIPAQSDDGEQSGTIDVTGQVDQGSSDNKGMRLQVALTEYSDGAIDDPETEDVEEEIAIVYATAEAAPLALDLQLRNIPAGTLSGTLAGTVGMTGDLEGDLELDIAFDGAIADDGAGGTERVEGTTEVTGTATSANGTFEIDTAI